MKLGRSPDAKTAFERALSLNPEYPDADNTLGALLAQSGDFQGAVSHLICNCPCAASAPVVNNNGTIGANRSACAEKAVIARIR
jgi:Flp pilus assembly protein TadD